MRGSNTPKRGTALLITVGLLAVLAVIGFGFAVLARLHHDISRYYRASAQNDLIARAAIHYAISEVRYGYANAYPGIANGFRVGAIAEPTDSPASPWFIDPTIASLGYKTPPVADGGDDKIHYCNLACNSYALVQDDLGDRIAVSMVKVMDCAGKLNINDRDGTDSTWLTSVLQTLLSRLGIQPSDTSFASKIIAKRETLPGKRFASLDQLKAEMTALTAEEFEILKHYVTVYSWPHQLPTTDGFPYIIRPETGGGGALERSESTSTPPDYVRSPININTAGEELIYAVLRNLQSSAGHFLSEAEAKEVSKWVIRKRDPANPRIWALPDLAGSAKITDATWLDWLGAASGVNPVPTEPTFKAALQREFHGWRLYPLGPFDSWHEVVSFLYSLAADAVPGMQHPFTGAANKLTRQKIETVLAGISPNTFPTGLVGHNAYNLAFAHHDKSANPPARNQFLRDRDAGTPVEPQVFGKNNMTRGQDGHPFCFSSMGRFEVYSRTYTFVKAYSGTCATVSDPTDKWTHLTDSVDADIWSASPNQWRGYSVLIHEGKGKGQLRGIVYVKDDRTANDGKGRTLIVDRWSIPPDATSRYLILGPGPLFDRPSAAADPTYDPAKITVSANQIADANDCISWEDDQWNGHRVVVYRASVQTGGGPQGEDIELVIHPSIQERTIIDTIKNPTPPGGRLIVAPPIDTTLLTGGTQTFYVILGADGVVEHSAAIKAYDVIHHTTQEDFEKGSPTLASVATGPNNIYAAGGSLTDASTIDGWLAARKKDVSPPPNNGFLQNFKNRNLAPDSGGGFHSSTPPGATILSDALGTQKGIFLSDGLHLANSTHYVDYTVTNLCTPERHEGGVVAFWFRPDEAFFTGTHTILRIYGEDKTKEELSLRVNNARLQLQVISTSDRQYEVTDWSPDPNHNPSTPGAYAKYRSHTSTHEDGTYKDISTWKAGEWHHIAFAWYECANDDEDHNNEPAYNTDGNPATNWRDDDTGGAGGKPDYRLDPEVICRLRIWVDGQSSAVGPDNEKPAFNFCTPAGGGPALRLDGGGAGTIDGITAYRITGEKTLDISINPDVRYETAAGQESTYTSSNISLPNTGDDRITLGAVTFTGFLPWMPDAERWGCPSEPPIRVKVSLGGEESDDVPKLGDDTPPRQGIFGGGPLLKNGQPITTTGASTIQYKVILRAYHGENPGHASRGLIKGRQTPVLDDITITYLGPIVFYYWQ